MVIELRKFSGKYNGSYFYSDKAKNNRFYSNILWFFMKLSIYYLKIDR